MPWISLYTNSTLMQGHVINLGTQLNLCTYQKVQVTWLRYSQWLALMDIVATTCIRLLVLLHSHLPVHQRPSSRFPGQLSATLALQAEDGMCNKCNLRHVPPDPADRRPSCVCYRFIPALSIAQRFRCGDPIRDVHCKRRHLLQSHLFVPLVRMRRDYRRETHALIKNASDNPPLLTHHLLQFCIFKRGRAQNNECTLWSIAPRQFYSIDFCYLSATLNIASPVISFPGIIPGIIHAPGSKTVLLNKTAVFTCEAGGFTFFRFGAWSLPRDLVKDSLTFTAAGTIVVNLTIIARAEYNGTIVECSIDLRIGVFVETENAILNIQGTRTH